MKKFIKFSVYLVSGILIYKRIISIIGRLTPSVNLDLLSDPYFVGAYQKIKVTVHGISFDDLDFIITEGAPGGYVSPCRDVEFDAAKDRKSTRLNSSHPSISYAVFCLKKKR